jgi:hypothetical protein
VPKLSQIPIEISEWTSLRQAVEWIAFNYLPLPEYLEIITPEKLPALSSDLLNEEQLWAIDGAKRNLFHAFVADDLAVMGKEGYGIFFLKDGEIEHTTYAPNHSRIGSHIWKLVPQINWHRSRCSYDISRDGVVETKSWSEIIIRTSNFLKRFPPEDFSTYDDQTATILRRMVVSSEPVDAICEDNLLGTSSGAENRVSDALAGGERVATSIRGEATANLPSSQMIRINPNDKGVSSAVTNRESVAEDYPPYIRFLIRIYRELGEEAVNRSKKEELEDIIRARWPVEIGEPSTNKISAMATFLRMPEAQRGGARRQRSD